MPLNLLPKKSWNVYNTENIARVRRDEALAKAREEDDETRRQSIDAERRIQILRGLRPPSPPPIETHAKHKDQQHRRKRRRLVGEDDTDRDIRLARDDILYADTRRGEIDDLNSKADKDAPLVDKSGHISLFPAAAPAGNEKNVEAEAEVARKKRSYEDQYTMRFTNAGGFKQDPGGPWYSSSSRDLAERSDRLQNKDVWGNEDPRRRAREKQRIDANDPLTMMKSGVRQLREVEKERKKWEEERRRDLEVLKGSETKNSGHRRRHYHRRRRSSVGSPDGSSVDDFNLDADENAINHSQRGTHDHPSRYSRTRLHIEDRDTESRHSRRHGDRHASNANEDPREMQALFAVDASPGWKHAPGKRYSRQFAGL